MTNSNLTRVFAFAAAMALAPATGTVAAATAAPTTRGVLATVPPPLSLTASDGSGLELASLSAQAVIEDPLSFTELHLIFRNPEARMREGRFRITLPPGATVSRFAMRVGDRWQEGEVVEQQAARVAYEDFLHRRQDPALLETEAGNEFSARVFPIPPNATKEIMVSYTQELVRADEPYRLPLRGLPRLGSLTIRALVNRAAAAQGSARPSVPAAASNLGGRRITHEVIELSKRDFKPDRDFEVPRSGGTGALGLRHDNLVAARVVPLAKSDRRDEIATLLVLVDTSASRGRGADDLVAFEALMAEVRKAGDPMVSVAAFDQTVAPLFSGRLSTMGDVVRKKLVERRALGASDFGRALDWLAGEANRLQKTTNQIQGAMEKATRGRSNGQALATRVLLITDGVVTAGDMAADKLRARVKALGSVGVGRLDALAVGGIRDDVLLGRLVTAGLARDGVVLDGAQGPATWATRLTRATRSGVKVEIDGAGWVWPAVLNGIQAGDEVIVYADLPRDKPFRLKVDGAVLNLPGALTPVERPLLERAWVRARISRLIEQRDGVVSTDRDLASALRTQAIDLSIKNRVLCPFTSLLVLETEYDYARFGIERRALADILTVGVAGIALLHRTDIAAPSHPAMGGDVLQDDDGPTPIARHDQNRRGDIGTKASESTGSPLARAEPTRLRALRSAEQPMKRRQSAPESASESESALDESASSGGRASAPSPSPTSSPSPSPSPSQSPSPAGAPVAVASVVAAPAPRARPRDMAKNLDSLLEGAVGSSGDAGPRRMATPAPALPQLSDRTPSPSVAFQPQPPRMSATVEGELRDILDLIHRGQARSALGKALAWRTRDAGDVLALVALGECWEAMGNGADASRAYGSIIDLFPGRADMRRFAGERLERIRGSAALALAVDTYRKAVEQRPDHPASHRLLGFALLKQGRPREAFEVLATGSATRYPSDRFRGVDRILREDLGLAAAAWMRADPAHADQVRARLARTGGALEAEPSLRFVLNWETDANDVDFHIHDAKGGHAYYSSPRLPSGGELYADVTTGYGPECFTIRHPAAGRAWPYRLQAHYYSRGPMGYGMGKLEVIEHDGRGGLRFDERPFVIMQDGAFVDLGVVAEVGSGGGVAAIAR